AVHEDATLGTVGGGRSRHRVLARDERLTRFVDLLYDPRDPCGLQLGQRLPNRLAHHLPPTGELLVDGVRELEAHLRPADDRDRRRSMLEQVLEVLPGSIR